MIRPLAAVRLAAVRLAAICLAALAGLWAVPLQAQSYNCLYAKTPSENLICDNPELGRMDEEMAAAYYGLAPSVQRSERGRQKRFLAARERCGYSFGCVASVYRQRIDSLYRLSSDF